jgi:hypothetical protein
MGPHAFWKRLTFTRSLKSKLYKLTIKSQRISKGGRVTLAMSWELDRKILKAPTGSAVADLRSYSAVFSFNRAPEKFAQIDRAVRKR